MDEVKERVVKLEVSFDNHKESTKERFEQVSNLIKECTISAFSREEKIDKQLLLQSKNIDNIGNTLNKIIWFSTIAGAIILGSQIDLISLLKGLVIGGLQ